jgi:hypothetical protein
MVVSFQENKTAALTAEGEKLKSLNSSQLSKPKKGLVRMA